MAKQIIKAPRGTGDLLGEETLRWQQLEQQLREASALFGFSEIRTPTFEQLDLFVRSVGDTTDVVQKEMYEVTAKNSRERYALKPEGTAGVIRSVIEQGALKGLLPQKFYYLTPCFRHERPQAGRLREFHQYGVEVFGTHSPVADVEVISFVHLLFVQLGLRGISLSMNSIGCPVCRTAYYQRLRAFYADKQEHLCGLCQNRLEKNPLRLLDCKTPSCAEMATDAPLLLQDLCGDCETHFTQVQRYLQAANIEFTINPHIVRGLDYYTKTVFEFIASDLGAQSAVCGGGRYDGLVEQLGGDPLPGIGFAIGLERLLLIMAAQQIASKPSAPCGLFVATCGEEACECSVAIVDAVRHAGISAEMDLMGRTLKAQLKYANKIGALFALVLGEQELATQTAQLKCMATGEQHPISLTAPFTALLEALQSSSHETQGVS